MIILKTTPYPTISHPSREPLTGQDVEWTIYNKSTREKLNSNNSFVYENGLLVVTLVDFEPKEGEQYYLIMYTLDGTKLLFNSNMYCTDETDLQDFSLLEGQFITPPQTDNTFKQHE